MIDNVVTTRKCPICGRPAVFRHRPFCSRRCADVDLGRWFTGAYAIPGEPVTDDEAGSEPPDRAGPPDAPRRGG
jgi:endogenous inhibitor of DNA gyrase (YacG/DUF329 family)